MAVLQPPPFKLGDFMDADGKISPIWRQFLLNQQAAIADGMQAAEFLLASANALLPNAIDLGSLVSGYLKIAVAAGAATPSTVAQVPSSDIQNLVVSKVFADSGYVATAGQSVFVNATAGATTIKLPTTATSGLTVTVKKTDASGNAVTVSGNGNNVDGAGTKVLASQWESITVRGDGSNWLIVSRV